jgi:hypothetical protein
MGPGPYYPQQQQMGWPGYPQQSIPYNGSDPRGLKLKHSPGPGLWIGLGGAVALLLSFFVLPWFSVGGEDVSFSDLRDAYNADDDTGMATSSGTTPDTSLPDITLPPVTSIDPNQPTFNTVVPPGFETQVTEPQIGTPVTPPPLSPSVSAPSDYDDRSDELEAFTDWGWAVSLWVATVGVIFTCLVVPGDRVARAVTGTLVLPCLGWVNLVDRDGSSAPRVLGGLAAIHTVLIVVGNGWYLFWDNEGSPDPGLGALLGMAGAIAVLVACCMGTKKEWVPAYAAWP